MTRLVTLFCAVYGKNCQSKETCNECIQEMDCQWCTKPMNSSNCLHTSLINSEWCQHGHIKNPKGSFQILEEKPLSNLKGKTVQISPQRVRLNLRKDQIFDLEFHYRQAKNYPVDLYYIMDLSKSMDPHRHKLGQLGDSLAQTMTRITDDFQIGFGSFVDKVALPFVSTAPEKLKEPCDNCIPAYSFKNHMSLSADYERFSKNVKDARVSGNLDAPEGGLDALMQVIVCKEAIGWRSHARHIIVFSTDADFHIAGDGKLAGVMEPNDGFCHMERDSYTHGLIMDYPSVSHINYVAEQNNKSIIFAIASSSKEDIYTKLSKELKNSNVGLLTQQSDNVVNLIYDNYNKIVNSVTMSSTSFPDVEIKINSSCASPKINGCTNVHVGEMLKFTARIKALKCETNQAVKRSLQIKPDGLNEALIVDLEIQCKCDCQDSHEEKSSKCSKSGTLECGVCECDPGFFGPNCECNGETFHKNDESQCRSSLNSTICSGLGVCLCGQCQCKKRENPLEVISGKYCDCDNFSCKRVKGELCSGRGSCECNGVCNCNAGWIGNACECPNSNAACVKPDGKNLLCNNHGSCTCGKCECNTEEVRFSGKFCDECPSCVGQRCEEFKSCVECRLFSNNCTLNCSLEVVDKLETSLDTNVKNCNFIDDDGCTFLFQYQESNEGFIVVAQKEKVCREPPNVLAYVFSVIGAIVLGGIILLIIWKVFTTVHDQREYAKFQKEQQNSTWHSNENPLFRGATSTFQNPAYRIK